MAWTQCMSISTDSTEDTAKLRFAVGRTARKRLFRTRPHDGRRGKVDCT